MGKMCLEPKSNLLSSLVLTKIQNQDGLPITWRERLKIILDMGYHMLKSTIQAPQPIVYPSFPTTEGSHPFYISLLILLEVIQKVDHLIYVIMSGLKKLVQDH